MNLRAKRSTQDTGGSSTREAEERALASQLDIVQEAHKTERDAEHAAILRELTAEAQKLKLGY